MKARTKKGGKVVRSKGSFLTSHIHLNRRFREIPSENALIRAYFTNLIIEEAMPFVDLIDRTYIKLYTSSSIGELLLLEIFSGGGFTSSGWMDTTTL